MKMISSYIAADVKIEGKITCQGSARIDGLCEGVVESKDEVIIGTYGKIQGAVYAESMMVNGHIEGDAICTGKVAILEEGTIVGDLHTPAGCISIIKGGSLEGKFHIAPP